MRDRTPLPPGCEARCPGCAHRGWSLADSLAQKQRYLAEQLAPWADRLEAVAGVDEPARWHYRDRLQLAAEWSPAAGWQLGLRRRDELIAIPHCPVQSQRAAALIALIRRYLPSPAEGFALSYLVQAGAQAVLVLKQKPPPPLGWLSDEVKTQLAAAGIEGLWLHLHPAAGKKVLAKGGWQLIWGQPRSRDPEGRLYGPAAFQQLMPALFEQALDRAEQFLNPSSATPVLDLYCGSGASLQRWLRHRAPTLGVELGGDALACAKVNAPGATLLRGSCRHRLPQTEAWRQAQTSAPTLLYTNPPRTGMETDVTTWIGERLRPQRIAYLSCSAGTLARDLALLAQNGYTPVALAPFDFFPHTLHVETLALLQLQPG